MGAAVKLTAFVRYEVGEGIEKAVNDFAAEVASFAKPKE
jgi:elongation factor Ts